MNLNWSQITTISLPIPVATASVEKSISQMKLMKTSWSSCLSDASPFIPNKNCDLTPNTLIDGYLEKVVVVYKKKGKPVADKVNRLIAFL